jgi:hypothetical protein
MKITKRRPHTAKKLVLPLIALAMMATMMFSASGRSPSSTTTTMQPLRHR